MNSHPSRRSFYPEVTIKVGSFPPCEKGVMLQPVLTEHILHSWVKLLLGKDSGKLRGLWDRTSYGKHSHVFRLGLQSEILNLKHWRTAKIGLCRGDRDRRVPGRSGEQAVGL